jgi:hypothetical protein
LGNRIRLKAALRAGLESLAGDLMVDLAFDEDG